MFEFLDSIMKLKDLQIVRFFSRFFTEDRLSPTIDRFRQDLAGGTAAGMAKELLVFALVLAIGAFIIDQIFYWTAPGQVDRARDTWQSVSSAVVTAGTGVRNLACKVRDLVRPQDSRRER